MKAYHMVIKCDRCSVPGQEDLHNFVTEKLKDEPVDFFGMITDQQFSYGSNISAEEINQQTFINIHFDHPNKLNIDEAKVFVTESIQTDGINFSDYDGKDLSVLLIYQERFVVQSW